MQQHAMGLLLGAPRAGDTDRQSGGEHLAAWRSAVNASSVMFTAAVKG